MHILSNSKWCNAIDQQEDKTISILSFGTSQSIKKGTETTIIPVKHAQWVAFLQQFINISLMQCPGYNKDNIINHMPVPAKTLSCQNQTTVLEQEIWTSVEENYVKEAPKQYLATYVIYCKNVDSGSVAWHSMCLYSSTSLRVHFSTIVVVCKGEGSAIYQK